MKYQHPTFLSICLASSLLVLWQIAPVCAIESTKTVPQSYDEYVKESREYCDSDQRPWYGKSSLVSKIDYPEFSALAVNTAIAEWSRSSTASNDEKMRLQRDLNPITIGEYSGLKTLEVARIGYRTRMNTLFGCAVVASRIDTIRNLSKLIGDTIKNKASEETQKLEKDVKKLSTTLETLKCNPEQTTENQTKSEIIVSLINASNAQYCQYRHYLNYIGENIEDVSKIQNIEKNIGQGSGTEVASSTTVWNKSYSRYQDDLSREIVRADTTLPKAIKAFIEMDQTYGAHILLVMIYDDYIKIRAALSKYMNLSSQIYQKANNAQSTNR